MGLFLIKRTKRNEYGDFCFWHSNCGFQNIFFVMHAVIGQLEINVENRILKKDLNAYIKTN
jgi:hypothetical protein